MSRRAAAVTQADVARVARVAKALGPGWRVVIEGSRIELVQGEPLPAAAPPQTGRGLKVVP